jgi:hypothetical protein
MLPKAAFKVSAMFLGLMLLSSAAASEYCTKEQYQGDHAIDAIKTGTIVKGPKAFRDSILVEEGTWFGMNYPKQIAFVQSLECAWGGTGGRRLLYMDVRSLGTGRLLATWIAGVLKPAEERPYPTNPGRSGVERENRINLINPGMSGAMEDENRIGLTGDVRTAFIKYAISECNKVSNSSTICSCSANAMADRLTIKELKLASANGAAGMRELWPKLSEVRKHCLTN